MNTKFNISSIERKNEVVFGFRFFQGQVPVFHTIMELPDALSCEVAVKVYQTKSPEAERGWFWCWKLDQGDMDQWE